LAKKLKENVCSRSKKKELKISWQAKIGGRKLRGTRPLEEVVFTQKGPYPETLGGGFSDATPGALI